MKRAPRPAADRLTALIERFAGRRIAVLADLVADEFVYGEIDRVSREAPVLILEHRETAVVPGGGGNTVANLRSLGARPIPVGVVGTDDRGTQLLDHFRRSRVPTSGIVVARGYETPTKSRILAGGVHTRRQQIVRVDRGAFRGTLSGGVLRSLRARLTKAVGAAEGLLIADYGYGSADPGVARELGQVRRSGAFIVTVDSRTRVERFRGVTAATPNQEEVEQALGIAPLATDRDVEEAGRKLLRRSGNRGLLVTRGAKGMSIIERRRSPVHIPAYGSDEVADVTGAGDTVIAAFTLTLLAGGTFLEAGTVANYAAGLVVMKAGTATVRRDELTAAIREDRP